jgi:sugar (pentulose or hexulose) kinase
MSYRRGRPRKTKTSRRNSGVYLLCAATAIGLPAQPPLTILASFGTDGNFYGTTANRGSPPSGTVCNYAVATHQNYTLAVKNGTFSVWPPC